MTDLEQELNAYCGCACRVSGPSKSCTKFGSCQLIEKAAKRIKQLESDNKAFKISYDGEWWAT